MKKTLLAILLIAIASATYCDSNSESNSEDSNGPYCPPVIGSPPPPPPPPPSCPLPPPPPPPPSCPLPPPPPPKPLDRRFTLTLQYAWSFGNSLQSCQGVVYWNGHNVGVLQPSNHGINGFTVTVKAK